MSEADNKDVPLLTQLRERRKGLLDEIAPSIENREKEREAFAEREAEIAGEATKAIELITRDDSKDADEKRSAVKDADKPLVDARAAFLAAEGAFEAEFDRREKEISALNQRISEQEVIEFRKEVASRASIGETRVSIGHEEKTYQREIVTKDGPSYFRDLTARAHPSLASQLRVDPNEADERLKRHGEEMNVEIPKRQQERERRANLQVDNAEKEFRGSFVGQNARGGLEASPFERRVTPNRTDGQGGFFVPPLWLVDEYIPGLRAGRVAAGLARNMDLPPGTDSINIPKLSTLTKVAPQSADNAPVASQDFTDTSVQANVKTLAGQEDIAIQLLEQSPGQIIDQVIMEDLLADYNRLVDRQMIYAPGASTTSLNAGEIKGIYPSTNWENTQTVTYTAATTEITAPGFNQVLGAMASKVAYNRYDLSNFHFLLHPRRWFWFATGLDGAEGKSGRPVVNVARDGVFNVSVLGEGMVPFEGLAGQVSFGPSVYIDANVPTEDAGEGKGLGGTDDVAIGAKWDDLWLFESELRMRVLPEILSGILAVRYQCYAYVAFLTRYGQSIAIGSGTGFSAPKAALNSSIAY